MEPCMAPAAAAALLLWRDWWLSSHFRAYSRPTALFALVGAPFRACRRSFCALSLISSGQWPPGHTCIADCTIPCINYSRPVLAMNRSDDLVVVIAAKCPHVF